MTLSTQTMATTPSLGRLRSDLLQRYSRLGSPRFQSPAFDQGLSGHCDGALILILLRLRLPLETPAKTIVGLRCRSPSARTVMREALKGVAELVAVERPLRLAHDYSFKATVQVGERGDEATGFGRRCGGIDRDLAMSKKLSDDQAVVRLDHVAGAVSVCRRLMASMETTFAGIPHTRPSVARAG